MSLIQPFVHTNNSISELKAKAKYETLIIFMSMNIGGQLYRSGARVPWYLRLPAPMFPKRMFPDLGRKTYISLFSKGTPDRPTIISLPFSLY